MPIDAEGIRPVLQDCGSLTVMFLNLDMKKIRTGIENAALLRAKFFERQLGMIPQFLTVNYHAYFAEVRDELLGMGLVSEKLIFRNMYDFFQEADGVTAAAKPAIPMANEVHEKWRFVNVAGTPDTRVYDETNQVLMYRKRSRQTGVLEYINYFHKGKTWRRDSYATSGFLSRIQFLDNETSDPVYEHYLRPDGSVALIQWFTGQGKNRQLTKIQWLSRQGFCIQEFRSQEGLVGFWLQSITSEAGRRYVMISDRSRIFYRPLRELKKSRGDDPKLVVIPVIHAVHTKSGFDVMHSKTNSNYASILEDLQAPDAVVVSTERQKQDIVPRYGQGNLQVISHPYEPSGSPSRFEDRDRFVVVYLARYSAEKNQAIAIRAFALVVRAVPQAQLRLYGHGSGKAALQELVKQLGLEQSVQVNDFVQDVSSVYESAGLSLLTSQGEGYGLVVIESLSHGCPMIAFDVNYGPSESIDEGETGFLVPFGDEALLADRMITILSDPDRHRRMSDNARRSSSRFRVQAAADKWRALIHSAVTSPREQPSASSTGQSLRTAYSVLGRMGFGRDCSIWFDWKCETLSLTLNEMTRRALTAEQTRELEEACRLLKLTLQDAPPELEPASISEKGNVEQLGGGSDVAETFRRIFRENKWGSTETVSGCGSTISQTQQLRMLLPRLLADLRVQSLLDVGCGDLHWVRHVVFDERLHYVGADVVETLIERNQERFGSELVRFVRLDVLTDSIPCADLILCRDCLVHLPNAEVLRALKSLCRSSSQWLLTTTFPGRRASADISLGKWRPLNLEAAPFCLPPPAVLLIEQCTQGNGRFADKSLGLWHLHDVANAIGHWRN